MLVRAYPKKYWNDLGVLLVIYSMMQLVYYIPKSALPETVQILRISPLWLLLLIVFLTGSRIVKKWNVPWLLLVWQAVHIVLIGLLMIKVAYVSFIGPIPIGIVSIYKSVMEFLISPLLYLGIGLIHRSIKQA